MFYWDDEVLGIKPSEGRFGSFNGRQTVLKEGVVTGVIVQFADNNETCQIQTLAYMAAEIGYHNISEFLLANLETPEVIAFLQTKEGRTILKSEFDFLKRDNIALQEENEALHDQNLRDYLLLQAQSEALIYAAAVIRFAEEQAEAYRVAHNQLVKQINREQGGRHADSGLRINEYGETDEFGNWWHFLPTAKGGLLQ